MIPVIIICFSTILVPVSLSGQSPDDTGLSILGPREVIKSLKIKENRILEAFMQNGTIITVNRQSPWHNASLFAHGSVLKDLDGKVIKEVIFFEATDARGDISWSVLWFPDAGKPGTIEIVQIFIYRHSR